MHEPFLNPLHTTEGLLVADPVLTLRRDGDFERLRLADPSSEFMPMTVVGVQNLP